VLFRWKEALIPASRSNRPLSSHQLDLDPRRRPFDDLRPDATARVPVDGPVSLTCNRHEGRPWWRCWREAANDVAAVGVKIHVALGVTAMRKGLDGLAMLVQGVLKQDPFSGHLFVFRGRKAQLLKIVFWDGTDVHGVGIGLAVVELGRGPSSRRQICLSLALAPNTVVSTVGPAVECDGPQPGRSWR
jgi:hypothetical protein